MNAEFAEILKAVLYIAGTISLIVLVIFLFRAMKFVDSARKTVEKTTSVLGVLSEDIKLLQKELHETLTNVQTLAISADETVEELSGTLERLNEQLDQSRNVVKDVQSISGHVRDAVGDAADTVHAARETVMGVIEMGQEIEQGIRRPVGEIVTVLSAVAKGIRAFRSRLLGNPDGRHRRNGYAESREFESRGVQEEFPE